MRNAVRDPRDAAIAHAIITLADMLGLAVIAEGVETTQQYQCLSSHGCRAFQGYLFGHPEPVEDFENRVMEGLANTFDTMSAFDAAGTTSTVHAEPARV